MNCRTELEVFLEEWNAPSDTIVAHTSGSTGTPKNISLLKSDMRASARATNAFFGLGHGDVFVVPLSFGYIAAKMMAVRALEAGGHLEALPPSNNFVLPDGRCALLAVVPSQVDCLLAHPQWATRIGSVIVGGAKLDDEKACRLMDCGYNAYETYGMTETCSHVALKKIGGDGCFVALPGITFRTDGRGCLVVDVPHMSVGHVVTNDLVEIVSPTTFRWLGRYDNVVNSGGIKIIPEHLEECIRTLAPDIDFQFVIVGVPSSKWGEELALVAELPGGDATLKRLDRLREVLSAKLDHVYLPKHFAAVDALPRTSNGKLVRKPHFFVEKLGED